MDNVTDVGYENLSISWGVPMKRAILFPILFFLLGTASPRPQLKDSIDFHVHVHEPAHLLSLLESMNVNGVEKSIILSMAYATSSEVASQVANDFIAEQANNRLVGFCSVPIKSEWYLREANRCFEALQLKGLKLHFGQEQFRPVNAEDFQRLENLAALSDKFRIPILVHLADYTNEGMRSITRTALKFPNAKFVVAHAFGTNYRELLNLAVYLSQFGVPRNIFMETSTMLETYAGAPEMDDIVWYFRKFGIDYFLWGSDWSYQGFRQDDSLKALRLYPFTEEERAKILRNNAVELLEGK